MSSESRLDACAPLRVLACEPYYGGSHRAFLDGWQAWSRHEVVTLTLPPRHWKWRMRHSALSFVEQIRNAHLDQEPWDALWCSSLASLAELAGLLPRPLRSLPRVAYFHENQLAYPTRRTDPRDAHFALTNLTTALSADAVWFNSAHNRDSLHHGLRQLLERMPDHQPRNALAALLERASVLSPGIDRIDGPAEIPPAPLRIVWAARWEHDKCPEAFLAALCALDERGIDFRVSVLGRAPDPLPTDAEQVRARLGRRVLYWGFAPSRQEYVTRLRDHHVVVSTAEHEFFGLAVLEAVSAGCWPVLPRRLVYPELFGASALYDGTVANLVARLEQLAGVVASGGQLGPEHRAVAVNHHWENAAPRLDCAIEEVVTRARAAPRPRAPGKSQKTS